MNNNTDYTTEIIEKTTLLISERFKIMPEYAQRLALGALNGIEAHGGDSADWETVVNTVNVVVASWVKNGTDFPSE